jgi:SAM-dependent methyltransferase
MKQIETDTKTFYADMWDALSLRKMYEQYKAMYTEHIEKWGLPQYINHKRCLDAGCGSGVVSRIFLEKGADHVCSVDLSEDNLTMTKENTRGFEEKSTLHEESVCALPFDDNTFEFSWSFGVLHHTVDPYKGFAELVRTTKPGGKIFVGLYGKGGLLLALLTIGRFFSIRCRIVPYKLTRWLCVKAYHLTGAGIFLAILDGLFAPIRETYTDAEIEEWGKRNRLRCLGNYDLRYMFYKWPRWLSGNGVVIKLFEK